MAQLPTEYGLDQVQELLSDCINQIGIGFHPDNLMWDYMTANGPTFTHAQAKSMQLQLDVAMQWCEENDVDIYALAMQSPEYQALISNIEDFGQ